MQAYRLRITDEAASDSPAEVPELPEEERTPPRRAVTPVEPTTPRVDTRGSGVGEPQAEPVAPDTRTPAERLRPGLVDPRLWERAGAPPEPEKSDFDRARERVYARIEMLNDSLAAEGEATRRATDWTFTDKDGKKWGVSPGKVHLGGVTLPLPLNLSGPPDKAKEARDRAAKGAEIDRQADRARVRGTLEEQIKTTREQRDRARTEKKDTTTAGGTD